MTTETNTSLPSFKAFLEASSAPAGNYVAAHIQGFSPLEQRGLDFLDKMSGKKTPDLHATVVYSPTTSVPDEVLKSYLDFYQQSNDFPKSVRIAGIDKFDATMDEDGNRPDLSTLVLKLDKSFLNNIHTILTTQFGLKHTYEDFSPHVTLRYDMSNDDCLEAMSIIRPNISIRSVDGLNIVNVISLYAQKIIKNWANK